MSDELTLQQAVLAWAQGKRVEASPVDIDWWLPVDPVGKCLDEHHSATVFTHRTSRFRLAPEPPKKRYRPWTPEEVPVGAWFRKEPKPETHCWLIVGWNAAGFYTSNELLGCIGFSEALEDLHSIDSGKTWIPCGVEVGA